MTSKRPKAARADNCRSNEPERIAVSYRRPADLTVPKNSPRKHTPRQIRQIARSIAAFGFVVPIIVDEHDQVVAGAARLQAAIDLGYAEVPTIQIRHLSEHQKMAFAIADNQLATLSKWNDPVLADQLKALSVATVDLDVEATGFSLAEIELRIQPVNLDDDQSDPADKLPLPLDGPPVTQPGDLWILGRHRLLCGSALDPDTYATVMNGDVADLVFTDPLNDAQIDGNAAGLRRREFAIALHEMSSEQIEDFLNWVCHLLVRNSRDGSIHYIATDWHHVQELLVAGTSIYQKLLDFCVWTKANAGKGDLYRGRHQLFAVFAKGTAHDGNKVGRFGRHRSNVWSHSGTHSFGRGTDEEGHHPTVKPTGLVADAILDCSRRGDLVLDPFLGSGTTLMAAERVGRRCCGLEIDTQFADVTIRRWQTCTGDQAVHAPSGRTFREMGGDRGRSG